MSLVADVNGTTRRHMPSRRKSLTWKVHIGGTSVFVSVGLYEDGTVGELWIEMMKYGAALRQWVGDTAQLFSIGLQYGIPLADLLKPFVNSRSEPCGPVEGHESITFCTSVMDLVARLLKLEFLDARTLAGGGPGGGDGPEAPPGDPEELVGG